MIVIDGSQGEGGGQILRTALTLALVTQQPFRIDNIRAGRPRPGLMRQHATAVEAACAISGGSCEGGGVGASSLVFRPGRVQPGQYRFAIGTAGSTGLVLQTVLLPLALAEGPSTLELSGGTHNPAAPPFDFLERSYLPLLARMGVVARLQLQRHGFAPAGGGCLTAEIAGGAVLQPVDFAERGPLLAVAARGIVADLAGSVALRELEAARRVLADWPEAAFRPQQLPAGQGPGNALLLEAQFAAVTEVVTGFGQMGLTAERVAKRAAGRMRGYLDSPAFCGPYLADQLLLPLALAGGGSFTTVKPSLHLRTGIDIVQRFLALDIALGSLADGTHRLALAAQGEARGAAACA